MRLAGESVLEVYEFGVIRKDDKKINVEIHATTKGYSKGANSYVTKPVDFNEFAAKIKNLQMYWVLVNALPK